MVNVFIGIDGSLTQQIDVLLQCNENKRKKCLFYTRVNRVFVDVGLRDQFFNRFLRSCIKIVAQAAHPLSENSICACGLPPLASIESSSNYCIKPLY